MAQLDVQPAFGVDNAVAVVFASDANYVPYLAAALASLIDHASADRNYDINILSSGIGEEDQGKVKSLAEGKPNISIRFLDVEALVAERAGDLFVSGHLSSAVYYRLFTPSIFKNYGKILYIDCDIIILADLSELYDIDLKNKTIGAMRDYFFIRDVLAGTNGDHLRQVGIHDPNSYFLSGLMLMNLSKMRIKGYEDKCIARLREVKTPRLHDQDILNNVLEGDVTYLNPIWNSLAWVESIGGGLCQGEIPDKFFNEYRISMECPKIIHYPSPDKPWQLPHLPHADIFWKYASLTPYYHQLMFDLVSRLSAENDAMKAKEKLPSNYLKFKYKLHAFLRHIPLKKMRIKHGKLAVKIKCRYLSRCYR